MEERHHVVIIGGGFGGLHTARSLKRAPVRITLIDKRNFHLFQPLLYQVATGGLSPANIAAPLRTILRGHENARVLLGEVTDFDLANRRVKLTDGECGYDTLIVATGVRNSYFGHDPWEEHAPGLKTLEDATGIRSRILGAFEAAERESDPGRVRALLTFVVVGGGPTGVELAGTLGEIARYTLRREFRSIDAADARILLVESSDRILKTFPKKLAQRALRSLERLGVTTLPNTRVVDIGAGRVDLRHDEKTERIETHTVVWAAGVEASPLGRRLAEATGAETDRAGRVVIGPDLTVPNHPEVFVIGDLALARDADGEPLPGMAPVAMQQGKYVARTIVKRFAGETLPPFRYRDLGRMATIGRKAAVVDLGWCRFSGYPAWLFWLFVHIMQLVQFQKRVLVFLQWAWNYFTFSRTARLITSATRRRTSEGEAGAGAEAGDRAKKRAS